MAVPVVALALLAPGLRGYTSELLRLWAPDLGWGLWAVAATWTLAGGSALVALVRRRSVDLVPDEGGLPRRDEHDHRLPAVQVGDLGEH